MAKRLVACILLLISCLLLFCGCLIEEIVPVSDYDDKTIAKIETSWTEGMAPFYRYFLRAFDFEAGTVTDTRVANFDNVDEEQLKYVNKDDYNNPQLITTFGAQQATALYNKIKSSGFLTWQDIYETDEVICDGGNERVKVYFTDGTVKSTYIYFKYPLHYDEIKSAFGQYLGASFYGCKGQASTRRFEVYQRGLESKYYSDYSEMSDVIDSIKDDVVPRDKDLFCAYTDRLKADASTSILMCPFLFSSSEEGVILTDVNIYNNNLSVSFDVYSPEYCDCDIRMYVFFVDVTGLRVNTDEPLQIKYVINNLAGGEGSYYYKMS